MTKVDLITGFLGSGKTTFIKKYVDYLINQGYKVGIIENDFGAVNVDMMLLQELEDKDCVVEMVAGGDSSCHHRRLKTKLIAMALRRLDYVIIEPSGIFDVEEFYDVLNEEPLSNWYEIGNIISLVEATIEYNISKEANDLLISQIATAGKVILSKVDLCNEETINKTISFINSGLNSYELNNVNSKLLIKSINDLDDNDFKELSTCSYVTQSIKKISFKEDEIFQSLYYMNNRFDVLLFLDRINKIFKDIDCGKVLRVKGFYMLDDEWYELNLTSKSKTINKIANGQNVIIVLGENLNKEKIDTYF